MFNCEALCSDFRERFTIPILEIVSSGDEFFLPDDNHNWWNGIPDPKYLMYEFQLTF